MNTLNTLKTVVAKKDYLNAKAEFEKKPWLTRIWLTITGRKPKDPTPGKSIDELATAFTAEYNRNKGFGPKMEFDDGYVSTEVKYNQDTFLPVLVITMYIYKFGCFFMERKKFNEDGRYDEWGIAYPYSECGVSGLPNDIPASMSTMVKAYRCALNDLSSVVREATNR